jgi:DNA-binding NarL/FixJ family response regulator
MTDLIRVAVIDDHPLFREGVVNMLKSVGEFDVVGTGAGVFDALKIAREKTPDIVLLDVNIAGGSLEAASELIQAYPTIRVIMLTASDDERHVESALKAGVSGYILKGNSGQEVVEAVRSIAMGKSYVAPNLAARLLLRRSKRCTAVPEYDFTSREKDVFASLARGMSNKEIARTFNCTERTVKHHVTNIMQKLNVRNRVQAALKFQAERHESVAN